MCKDQGVQGPKTTEVVICHDGIEVGNGSRTGQCERVGREGRGGGAPSWDVRGMGDSWFLAEGALGPIIMRLD